MAVRLEVEVRGEEEVRNWLLGRPTALLRAIQEATTEGTALVWGAVKPFTPVRTGKLLSSQTAGVSLNPAGATGIVKADVREASFTEHGTREHGRARHWAERGLAVEREPIKLLFDVKIRQAFRG